MKTDAQLQQDVISELKWEPSVNAAQIGVEVKNGIGTLAGHVGSYAEKYEAEHAAQRVSGVKALAIEMDVKLAGSSKRTDADIASAVQNVLQWTTYLPKDHVKVMVEGGWVTLTGEVDWEYQRQSATGHRRFALSRGCGGRQRPDHDQEAQGVIERRQIGHRGSAEAARNGRCAKDLGRSRWRERDLDREGAQLVRARPGKEHGLGHRRRAEREGQPDRRVLRAFANLCASRSLLAMRL